MPRLDRKPFIHRFSYILDYRAGTLSGDTVFNQTVVICCGLVLACPAFYALQGRALTRRTYFAFRLLDRLSNRFWDSFANSAAQLGDVLASSKIKRGKLRTPKPQIIG